MLTTVREIRILQGFLDVEGGKGGLKNGKKSMLEKIENHYRQMFDTEPYPRT